MGAVCGTGARTCVAVGLADDGGGATLVLARRSGGWVGVGWGKRERGRGKEEEGGRREAQQRVDGGKTVGCQIKQKKSK